MRTCLIIWGIQLRAYVWVAFYAVLVAGTLNQTRPYHGDESFYIVSSIGMLESGDYLAPVYFGQVRFQKPILPYWIAAAGHWVFGVTMWSGRVGHLLLACGLLLLVYKFAWLIAADHTYALLSTVLLSSATLFVELSRVAMPDVPLAFFSTIALYCFCKSFAAPENQTRWQLAAFGAMGVAFASKGLLAVVPGLAAAGTVVMSEPRRWAALRRLFRPTHLVLFAVPGFLWYVYVFASHPTVVFDQFRRESAANLSFGLLQALEHLAFYAGAILAYCLPFAAAATYLAVRHRCRLPQAFLPVTLHVAGGLLVLALAVRMHYPRYLLVILPELTLLAAFILYRQGHLRVTRATAAAWAGLQIAFFLGYPCVAGDPLKTLVAYWDEHLEGELVAYELPSREKSWVLALSRGRLSKLPPDSGAYVILDERRLADFPEYQVIRADSRLQSVRLEGLTLTRTKRCYLLIKLGLSP